MKHLLTATALIGLLMAAIPASAAVETGKMAPEFTLTDIAGETHSLSSFKGKHVVLEWVNPDCPFVVKHYKSGNMPRLQKEWTEKGVVWLAIQTTEPGHGQFYSEKEIKEYKMNKGARPTAVLMDSDGKVGRKYGAKTTPHMYVINPDGKLIYQGAIDSIPSANPADIEKADNYVHMALVASMNGESPKTQDTRPYGCSVKYAN